MNQPTENSLKQVLNGKVDYFEENERFIHCSFTSVTLVKSSWRYPVNVGFLLFDQL